MEGEQVLDVTTGMVEVRRMGSDTTRNGTVAVTDRRIILFTKKLGGYDVQDFAFGLLTSVDHKKGMMFGNLDLAASGDRTKVTMVPKEDVERIAQMIRQKMASAHSHPVAAASADVATQIRELAKLRDEGLLSTEEFEGKKRQILGL
jgi:hypothetical protein